MGRPEPLIWINDLTVIQSCSLIPFPDVRYTYTYGAFSTCELCMYFKVAPGWRIRVFSFMKCAGKMDHHTHRILWINRLISDLFHDCIYIWWPVAMLSNLDENLPVNSNIEPLINAPLPRGSIAPVCHGTPRGFLPENSVCVWLEWDFLQTEEGGSATNYVYFFILSRFVG